MMRGRQNANAGVTFFFYEVLSCASFRFPRALGLPPRPPCHPVERALSLLGCSGFISRSEGCYAFWFEGLGFRVYGVEV